VKHNHLPFQQGCAKVCCEGLVYVCNQPPSPGVLHSLNLMVVR
jgi:hypothetical protein